MPTRHTETTGRLLRLPILRKQCMQKYNEEMGIAWEYVPVLEHIKRNPGCMQADISKKMRVTPAAVTQSTKKLESAGLIEKVTEKDNLRVKRMYITDKGMEAVKRGTKIFDKIDAVMFEGISDEDIERLEEILDIISGNIKNHIDKKG